MELKILSAQEAQEETLNFPNYWNVISIKSAETGRLRLVPKNIINLNFADIVKPVANVDYILPNKEEIKKGLDFARKHWNGSLLIHCTAGISRSTALALVILYDKFRNLDFSLKYLYRIRPVAYPNELVIDLGFEILCDEGSILTAYESKQKLLNKLKKHKIWIENHKLENRLIVPSWIVK